MVRTPNIGSISYEAGDPPASIPGDLAGLVRYVQDLQRYLREREIRIAAVVAALAAGHLDKQTVAPAKPRDGDIRYADGVSWNPIAAGAGIYWFNGTVWTKL